MSTGDEVPPVNVVTSFDSRYRNDGLTRFLQPNAGSANAYRESSLIGGPVREVGDAEPAPHGEADSFGHRGGSDDYTQPGNVFRMFDTAQRQRLFQNIAAAMQGVPGHIVRRQLAHFEKADPAYAAGVANALALASAAEKWNRGTSAIKEEMIS